MGVAVVRRLGEVNEAEEAGEGFDIEEEDAPPAPTPSVLTDRETADAIGAAARKISRGLLVLSVVLLAAALIVAA